MKINYIKKTICIAICLALTGTLFSACSGKEKIIDFIYPFYADVNSYDPQIAATTDEFLIIENTFEGLIRINDDGTVKQGVAERWEISEDKRTYTFYLKKGLKWNIDTEIYKTGDKKGEYKDRRLQWLGFAFNPDITAHDFVFALRRAVLPSTNAPLFPAISCIVNANKIHNKQAKAETLGVSAPDDYTLIIQLETPDDTFMETLSSSIAMPCNEAFFNATKGRYGLETKYTLFNGQFYVSQLLESSYLLKKNEFYKGTYPAYAKELTLKIVNNQETDKAKSVVARLEKGYYDAAFITGKESDALKTAEGITYIPYEDTTWALLLNTGNEIFQSKRMRRAFCLGLSDIQTPEKEYLKPAYTLLPESCTLGGNQAVAALGTTKPAQDTAESMAQWKNGLSLLEINDITLTIVTTPEMETSLKQMLQSIQSGIATIVKDNRDKPVTFTIKVETLPLNELEQAVARREYDAALYPFKSTSTSAIAFLKTFAEKNKTGFSADKLETALMNAEKATTLTQKTKYLKIAEKEIIYSYSVYPMLRETSYYATANGVSGIQFHAGSGRVSFVNATRKK